MASLRGADPSAFATQSARVAHRRRPIQAIRVPSLDRAGQPESWRTASRTRGFQAVDEHGRCPRPLAPHRHHQVRCVLPSPARRTFATSVTHRRVGDQEAWPIDANPRDPAMGTTVTSPVGRPPPRGPRPCRTPPATPRPRARCHPATMTCRPFAACPQGSAPPASRSPGRHPCRPRTVGPPRRWRSDGHRGTRRAHPRTSARGSG